MYLTSRDTARPRHLYYEIRKKHRLPHTLRIDERKPGSRTTKAASLPIGLPHASTCSLLYVGMLPRPQYVGLIVRNAPFVLMMTSVLEEVFVWDLIRTACMEDASRTLGPDGMTLLLERYAQAFEWLKHHKHAHIPRRVLEVLRHEE